MWYLVISHGGGMWSEVRRDYKKIAGHWSDG